MPPKKRQRDDQKNRVSSNKALKTVFENKPFDSVPLDILLIILCYLYHYIEEDKVTGAKDNKIFPFTKNASAWTRVCSQWRNIAYDPVFIFKRLGVSYKEFSERCSVIPDLRGVALIPDKVIEAITPYSRGAMKNNGTRYTAVNEALHVAFQYFEDLVNHIPSYELNTELSTRILDHIEGAIRRLDSECGTTLRSISSTANIPPFTGISYRHLTHLFTIPRLTRALWKSSWLVHESYRQDVHSWQSTLLCDFLRCFSNDGDTEHISELLDFVTKKLLNTSIYKTVSHEVTVHVLRNTKRPEKLSTIRLMAKSPLFQDQNIFALSIRYSPAVDEDFVVDPIILHEMNKKLTEKLRENPEADVDYYISKHIPDLIKHGMLEDLQDLLCSINRFDPLATAKMATSAIKSSRSKNVFAMIVRLFAPPPEILGSDIRDKNDKILKSLFWVAASFPTTIWMRTLLKEVPGFFPETYVESKSRRDTVHKSSRDCHKICSAYMAKVFPTYDWAEWIENASCELGLMMFIVDNKLCKYTTENVHSLASALSTRRFRLAEYLITRKQFRIKSLDEFWIVASAIEQQLGSGANCGELRQVAITLVCQRNLRKEEYENSIFAFVTRALNKIDILELLDYSCWFAEYFLGITNGCKDLSPVREKLVELGTLETKIDDIMKKLEKVQKLYLEITTHAGHRVHVYAMDT